jgi:hypothetical protein
MRVVFIQAAIQEIERITSREHFHSSCKEILVSNNYSMRKAIIWQQSGGKLYFLDFGILIEINILIFIEHIIGVAF